MTESRGNRALILSPSLLAGAAGLVPVPYVDDLLAGAVRTALMRRIGQIRQVDLDSTAAEILIAPHDSTVFGAARLSALALGNTRRAFPRLAPALLWGRAAPEAGEASAG